MKRRNAGAAPFGRDGAGYRLRMIPLASSGPPIIAAATIAAIALMLYLLRLEDREYEREKEAGETPDEDETRTGAESGST